MSDQEDADLQQDEARTDQNEPVPKFDITRQQAASAKRRVAIPLKIFGVLGIIGSIIMLLILIPLVRVFIDTYIVGDWQADGIKPQTFALSLAEVILDAALCVSYFLIGYNLICGRRQRCMIAARLIMVLLIVQMPVVIMVSGITPSLLISLILIIILIVLQCYLDPSLIEERQLKHRLRLLDEKKAEDERLALKRTYGWWTPYKLNFFNLFWTFVICSIVGLLIEEIAHFITDGDYQDRAGLLFGPFSPIYGAGTVILTLLLNRLRYIDIKGIHNKVLNRALNIIIIFFLSALIGGAFEYFVSWFLQFGFGVTAWDYTGTFLSIGGRTNGLFMFVWGLLGILWIELCMPLTFHLIYLIPWNWRYAVTGIATALMVFDVVMTLLSVERWYERESGVPAQTWVEKFFDEHFDDTYMANRFQTMTMEPDTSTRLDTTPAQSSSADSGLSSTGSGLSSAGSDSSSGSAPPVNSGTTSAVQ